MRMQRIKGQWMGKQFITSNCVNQTLFIAFCIVERNYKGDYSNNTTDRETHDSAESIYFASQHTPNEICSLISWGRPTVTERSRSVANRRERDRLTMNALLPSIYVILACYSGYSVM